ncbi:transcription factor 7-like 1-A isoform X3 [Nerophis ophidion]|uniref:transcription factor 7-like 1-A isoform X3 n=1 Tax=Nerophis ophidion TaxID=159077 RepID=UPI002ADFCEAB|nr:transcription factor 7-like 1-A isoform X3 [Nerophis ophidion]
MCLCVQKKNLPVVPLPEGATLRAVGMLNGEVLYAAVEASQGATAAAPPPPSTSTPSPRSATSRCSKSTRPRPDAESVVVPCSGKASLPCFSRKRKCKQRHRRACNKKPPSAFMCFLREKRPALKAQIEQKDAVGVNKLLGQLWASLTKEQKAKYYEQAYAEKKLLEQMSSDGSSSNDEGANKRGRNSNATSSSRAGRQEAWDTQDGPSSSDSCTSSSSSISSWLENVITTEAHDSPAAKGPDSGEESDIEGMDAKLLHLLGCC